MIIKFSYILHVYVKQGSALIDLRLTWREMRNLIFERFIRIFEELLEDGQFLRHFGEICSLLEEDLELPSIRDQQRK